MPVIHVAPYFVCVCVLQVGQVVVVGEIVEVNETQTNISYKIDDRTGPLIEVRKWINEEVRSFM